MTTRDFPCRMALLPLALAASFSSLAQAPALEATRITATRFAEPAQSLPIGVSVITAQDIRGSGALTVNEALMRLLGVVGRQDFYGAGEYNLDLRGFGATADNNQLVILDGQKLTEADLGGTRLSGIPIDAVERIEVLRGSGAVLWGEGATGGVIVITTRAGAGTQRRNQASLQVGSGSYGLRDGRANATVAGGGFSLDLHAQRRESQGYRANARAQADSGMVTGQWANDWLRLGARAGQDKLDARLPGALTAQEYQMDPRQSSRPGDRARIESRRHDVFFEAQRGAWQIAGNAGTRTKALASSNSGFAYDYDVEASDQSLRARHEGRLGGGDNVLVLGTDQSRWQREVLGAFGASASQRSRAVFARNDFTLPGGTRIGAGWRSDRISKAHSDVSTGLEDRQHAWDLGASQLLAGGVTLYGRAGRSYRLANVDEFSFTAAPLQPQVSRDLEGGARWRQGTSSIDARLYRSLLDNEIGYDPEAAGPFGFPGSNVNFDPTRRQGLELDAVHTVSRELAVRLHAALRQSTFRGGPNAGRDVPLAPRRALTLRADWTPAAAHRVSGGLNWVSSQHPDFANACSMPAYTTADLRYAYQWQKLELALGVANLFDRKYFTQAFGCTGGVTTSIYPETGRAFRATLRAQF